MFRAFVLIFIYFIVADDRFHRQEEIQLQKFALWLTSMNTRAAVCGFTCACGTHIL